MTVEQEHSQHIYRVYNVSVFLLYQFLSAQQVNCQHTEDVVLFVVVQVAIII